MGVCCKQEIYKYKILLRYGNVQHINLWLFLQVFNNIVAKKGTPVFLHAGLFGKDEVVADQAKKATLALQATLIMKEQ